MRFGGRVSRNSCEFPISFLSVQPSKNNYKQHLNIVLLKQIVMPQTSLYSYLVSFSAAIGGLLFGYEIGLLLTII